MQDLYYFRSNTQIGAEKPFFVLVVEHCFMIWNQHLSKSFSLTCTNELYCKTEKLIKALFIQLHAVSLLYLDKQAE